MAPSDAGAPDIQKTAFNGAQVTSLFETIAQVARGEIPRESAVEGIATAFNVSLEEAEKLLGPAGTPDFTPPGAEPVADEELPPPAV